jgi:hypothetical protein
VIHADLDQALSRQRDALNPAQRGRLEAIR